METYKGLPLFDLSIADDINGVDIISLVDMPAIQRDFIKFSKDIEVDFSVNEEKHVISGPALIPDLKIFRRNDKGEEFYVQFSKDAIEQIVQKFYADHNSTNVNLMHEYDVDGVVYFESYLIDHKRGLCPVEFNDLPDGTWIVSAKVYNEGVWKLVKDGVLRGFSIEGNLHITEAGEKEIDTIEDLIEALKNK